MLVFVYGTLKRDQLNSPILDNQEYKGECCTVQSRFKLYQIEVPFQYPALVEREDGYRVYGELYEVSERCLLTLDRIEGVSQGLYERKTIKVKTVDGKEHDALAYHYLQEVQGTASACWPAFELDKYFFIGKKFKFRDNKPALYANNGSKLSPSFDTINELAKWASENLEVFGGDTLSTERWQVLLNNQYGIAQQDTQ